MAILIKTFTYKGLDLVRIYGLKEMIPQAYVKIDGHVKQPGRYPLLEQMTLYDLIFNAGGYVDEDYKSLTYLKRAELVRILEGENEKEIIPFDLDKVLKKQGIHDTVLRSGDAVKIYSIDDVEGSTQYVSISGYVKRPGQYELYQENMKIYDLVFMAGGFEDPLFRSQAFIGRADLLRFEEDRISKTIIPINLGEILSDKNHEENIILLPGDEIKIYSETVFNMVYNVTINGVVRNPGSYELKTGMTIKDLILEAGGTNENVYRYKVEVARIDPLNSDLNKYADVITFDIDEKFIIKTPNNENGKKNNTQNSNDHFLLKPYDLVSIRPDPYFSNQKQIKISGEVLYPGEYTIINSKEKITDIIKRSGGLLPECTLKHLDTFVKDRELVFH